MSYTVRNYLRVRGEYHTGKQFSPTERELPPRARRIHFSPVRLIPNLGTTSACAENTVGDNKLHTIRWNYLRVRGEYLNRLNAPLWGWELPPRARRIRPTSGGLNAIAGTTSACAENTKPFCAPDKPGVELPPRARRILSTGPGSRGLMGTTSACAENTLVA